MNSANLTVALCRSDLIGLECEGQRGLAEAEVVCPAVSARELCAAPR